MTPERWQQVGELYSAASELPAETRGTFLRDACGDDEALRAEVETLLASGPAAGAFLNAGAMADAAAMLTEAASDSLLGRNLGRYTVLALVGAGGMGEVYRAHDSRLHRDVAVKVLAALTTENETARQRFDREAQAVAALSHPNIRSLYDVGEADGRVYAVMELLEGETLRARLARGPLPWRKAIEMGAAIADGLAAAHAHGIVHRDIKPENVFVTAGGQVKVLDFGLAKMHEAVDPQAHSQTLPGAILGTASYMAPEQVSGSKAVACSDIFSLGCVLYEMVSGGRAFARKTSVETMMAILNDEPPGLPPVAGELRRIVAHCLEKQPEARFQSAQDLAFQLRGLLSSADGERRVRLGGDRRLLWSGIAVLLLVTTVILSLTQWRNAASPARRVRFDISPPDNTTFSGAAFALSPDGSRLAFVTSSGDAPAHHHLWVHALDTGESQPLAGVGEVSGGSPPVWSPDGRLIAFVAEGRIRKVPLSGGTPQTIAEGPPLLSVQAWGADDIIIFSSRLALMKVSAAGGAATPLTALDPQRGEVGHGGGRLLPDREHFVYTRSSLVEGMSGIFVGSVAAKPEQQDSKPLIATRVGRVDYAPATDDSRVGHLLYNREGTLLAQRFDAARLELGSDPVPVAEQIAEEATPRRPGWFSISRNGTLVYRHQETVAGMPVWVDPSDRKTTPILDTPPARLDQLQLSPDGRRLAAIVAGDVWVYNLGGRPPLRLTSDGGNDMLLWSPDGTRILFTRANERLLSIPSDVAGATPEQRSPSGHFHPVGWSSDGRELVVVQGTYSATGYDIVGIPLHEKGEPRGIVRTPSEEGVGGAALSPDGKWLAYTSNATGHIEIWVQPYASHGAPIRVSPHGGSDPHWARDGRHLYYIQNTRMMDVAIESGSAFDFKPPTFLFEVLDTQRFPVQSYDVARDGRFIMIKPVATRASADPIHVILNWTAGLTK